ncbi:guanine nucleotide exchange factor [Aspergillus luchuensis]|uniref:Guanine nucleotide exchange factor n=1 Tax=Aspergillus kawachii TaxID=1069201 RepID=A0A146F6C0_ASPKA|nr:guanine nucleotide exchange factor [Aspergillus luchuensis]
MEESSKHPVAFKIGQAFHGLELSEQLPTFIPEEASEDDTSSEYVE